MRTIKCSDKTEAVRKPTGEAVLAAAPCSAVVPRDKVMAAEAALMTAAAEFGRAWGYDQREHPRSYWLELHISRWSDLARCALAYAECFGENPPNDPSSATRRTGGNDCNRDAPAGFAAAHG